jgi:hypothetical protein
MRDQPREQETQAATEPASTATMTREPQAAAQARPPEAASGLINDQKLDGFAGRWDAVQAGFVDDPRRAVEQADQLVAEVIDHLSRLFTQERARLESHWSKGGQVETEDLRIAIQRYREFFRTLIGR